MSGNSSRSSDALLVSTDWAMADTLLEAKEWVFQRETDAQRFVHGQQAIVYLSARDGPFSAICAVIEADGQATHVTSVERTGRYLLYPNRVPIRIVSRAKAPVPFKPIMDELTFVPHGPSWGLAFKGKACRVIPERDFTTMQGAIKRNSGVLGKTTCVDMKGGVS